ncbi:hypothetical protein OZX69_02960 [Lactobacillus sp. ESL0731]|uniref:hypothetical protein n=1 Tax=unclassified Lactobacillus TaxID=2620435 RepID=UPI0023F73D3D|nr:MULTISPECIES: hypothetical protein [unclassified Lactobacillus]WEV51670.1 hypothetical protein OZX63_02960 [Lactobacillus sp. ESL0700]WEV62799.1 hypothetical protein OZX69_02960 [Lactobacillus sp. ESL0731]
MDYKNYSKYDDVVKKTKLLLPNSDNNPSYENVVDFTVEKAINDVANYCNTPIDELPAELCSTIVSLTVQLLDTHGWLNREQNDSNVGSITEGDVSVTFKQPSEVYKDLQVVNAISDDFRSILNRFRRLPPQ